MSDLSSLDYLKKFLIDGEPWEPGDSRCIVAMTSRAISYENFVANWRAGLDPDYPPGVVPPYYRQDISGSVS